MAKNKLKKKIGEFRVSRELARQQTRPKPVQGDLFSCLSEEEKKDALRISKDEDSGLLSQIVDGIEAGEVVSKVIIAFAQVLWEQSFKNGSTETENLLGIKDEISKFLPQVIPTNDKLLYSGGAKVEGKEAASYSPYISFELGRFTRRVLGYEQGHKVQTVEKNNVADAISILGKKQVYISTDTHHIGTRICSIEGTIIDKKTKVKTYFIKLNPIFTREILRDSIVIRDDTLIKLRGRQKGITMRLFWFLAEQNSYHKPTWPVEKVRKDILMSKIAVSGSYNKNKTRRDEDFAEAIDKMKYVGLIENSEKGYKEYASEANDAMISEFRFNADYVDK